MTNSEARKRNQAAQAPQQPHQQPNSPALDSGAIGRLTEAERAALATVLPESEWDYDRDRLQFEMQQVVEVVLREHVTAALAEVESGIRRWDASSATPVKPYDHGVRRGMRHAADYVRDYREGVGR